MVSQYAVVCCGGNTELAALELRRQLRDHVVFERCAAHHCSMVSGKQYIFILTPSKMLQQHWSAQARLGSAGMWTGCCGTCTQVFFGLGVTRHRTIVFGNLTSSNMQKCCSMARRDVSWRGAYDSSVHVNSGSKQVTGAQR